MAKFVYLASLLLLAFGGADAKRQSRAERHSDIAKRVPEAAAAPVEVALDERSVEDIEDIQFEKKSDFEDDFDAADELRKMLERKDLVWEMEESSHSKRATFFKATVPYTVQGTKSGIGSWFRANNKADYTNGKSWCGIPYRDNMLGFAINMDLMSKAHPTYYSNPSLWRSTAKKFCGLEAQVSYNGKTVKMYVMDAFDPRWVRTTYSVDVLKGAFEKLFGKSVWDKNTVMKGLKWKMTGRRNKTYAFQG